MLAAGEGVRLRPHTLDRPKCLVELAGRSLISYQLDALAAAGIDDITLVTGYRAPMLQALGYPTRHNPDYSSTNMVHSLMCAADLLDGSDDVLVAYADIVYEARSLAAVLRCDAPICTGIDRQWRRLWELRFDDPLADAETLRLGPGGTVLELGKRPKHVDEIEGQYMGMVGIRAEFAPHVLGSHEALDPAALYDGRNLPNLYMTSFLQHMIDAGTPLRAALCDGGWLEVDSVSDLQCYERLYRDGALDTYCRLPRAGSSDC